MRPRYYGMTVRILKKLRKFEKNPDFGDGNKESSKSAKIN